MSALDKSMRDLIAEHGLVYVSAQYHGGDHFSVCVQWDAVPRGCAIGTGESTASALESAITQMRARRGTPAAQSFDGELAT